MATPSMTVEEIQLRRRARHRLAGAVTLVTLLVVFLPMVLDSEPKPVAEDIAINIPSQDARPVIIGGTPPQAVAVPRQPLPGDAPPPAVKLPPAPPEQSLAVLPGGQTAQASASAAKIKEMKQEPVAPEKISPPPPPAENPPAMSAQAAKEIKTSPPVKETKAPPPAAEKVKSAAPPEGGFVVRLGAFSKPENARRLETKLSSMGVRHYSDVLKTATGDKHRVRAGPFATHREAEAVRARLKAVNVDGDVAPKP